MGRIWQRMISGLFGGVAVDMDFATDMLKQAERFATTWHRKGAWKRPPWF